MKRLPFQRLGQVSIRTDADADDLLAAVASLCMSAHNAGTDRAERMVSLLVDGLRYGAGLSAGAPA